MIDVVDCKDSKGFRGLCSSETFVSGVGGREGGSSMFEHSHVST